MAEQSIVKPGEKPPQQIALPPESVEPTALHVPQWRALLSMALENAVRHKLPRLAASLAFYTILSLAPAMIVVVAIGALFFSRDAAVGQLSWQIRDWVGADTAALLAPMIKAAQKPTSGPIATVLGLLTIVFGASGAATELRDALNTIWDAPKQETERILEDVLGWIRSRALGFLMVLAIGAVFMISIGVNLFMSRLITELRQLLPTGAVLLGSANLVLEFFTILLIFAAVYRLVPDLPITWKDVLPGALLTSILFVLGRYGIAWYLGRASLTSAWGAAGSVVVILVWVYYSAQIFFIGAEFSHAYAEHYGSRPKERARNRIQLAQ